LTKIKIAIVGARGIANYGGFETVVSEIAPRFVKLGYDVYCSCEKNDEQKLPDTYCGAHLIYFPIKPPKNYLFRKINEVSYDIYFIIKCSLFCDLVYVLGVGTGILLLFPRFFHKTSVVNIDGLEWKRQKFSFIEKKLLHLSFNLAAMSANYVIVDNKQLINHVIGNPRKIIYVPNGIRTHAQVKWDAAKLVDRYGSKVASIISRAAFWLVVARLEPENNIHIIVEAFMKAETRFPLVIIGDFTSSVYQNEIYAKLSKSEKILFLGALYDIDLLDMLRQNCFAYIHGHSVGGTNPSLLEIMSMEKIVIAYASVFNKEVGQESLLYFRNSDELSQLIIQVEDNPSANAMAKTQIQRIQDEYNWNAVVEKYESLFSKI